MDPEEAVAEAVPVEDLLPELRAITSRHGVFLRREAVELGLDDRSLRRGMRKGWWVKVRHGAYALEDDWRPLGVQERHSVLTRAVLRTLGDRVAASHHSGCVLHGMDLWGVDLAGVHVTRTDGGAGRTEGDVTHHEGLCLDDDLVPVGEHRATRAVRAALESASLSGVERGLVVVNSGLNRGLFTTAELEEQHRLMQSWPESRSLQLVTRLANPGVESVGESRALYLMWSQGLPMPQLQFEVREGGVLVGTTDFAWPEHGLLGEFDGKVKYQRYLRPGEDPADALFREKRREDALRRVTGWRMVRLVWADLADPRRTAAMIRGELLRVA